MGGGRVSSCPENDPATTKRPYTYTVDEPELIEIGDVELGAYEWACIFVDPHDGYIEMPIWAYHDEGLDEDNPAHDPVHVVMLTPDEARILAEQLAHAAQHGDVIQRRN